MSERCGYPEAAICHLYCHVLSDMVPCQDTNHKVENCKPNFACGCQRICNIVTVPFICGNGQHLMVSLYER